MHFLHSLKGSDPWPRTHNALNDFYQFHFRESVRRGDQEPYIWPHRSFGVFVLLAYLLLPPTKSRIVHYAFYPVFAFFSWWSIRAIFETKSASLAATYGIGIVNTWAILWVAARMLFTDYRTARRVERRLFKADENGLSARHESAITSATERASTTPRHANGKSSFSRADASPSETAIEYYWQTLPSKFSHRLDFVIDLLFSMRGSGWAHQARSIPAQPQHIAQHLSPKPPTVKPAVREYKDKKSLLWNNATRFLVLQLVLDGIKTIMTHDPYFLGFVDDPPPAPAFFPLFIQNSSVLTKWYRLILAMFATRTALGMIFSLSPLFFSGILGPQIMGLRAEPWYYSDFGGDWRYLLSDGIAGWWGAWWHQIFRLGFEAPSKWACERLGWNPRSAEGKVLAVFTAFTCSGLLHGFASITMLPETKPWSGPFLFFQLQALGTIIEDAASRMLREFGITQRTPKLLRQVFVAIWLATWAYYTGPFLVDDFCRGGVWLFEPAPISFLKMMGFGEPNDHWWRWRGRNVFWYTGDRWWKSGIAV